MARGEAAALSAAGGAPLAHQRNHGKDDHGFQLAPEPPRPVRHVTASLQVCPGSLLWLIDVRNCQHRLCCFWQARVVCDYMSRTSEVSARVTGENQIKFGRHASGIVTGIGPIGGSNATQFYSCMEGRI